MCTNTSFEPSSGLMKPKPLLGLKNFTVPVDIAVLHVCVAAHDMCGASNYQWERTRKRHPQAGIVDGPTANSMAILWIHYSHLQAKNASSLDISQDLRSGARPAGDHGKEPSRVWVVTPDLSARGEITTDGWPQRNPRAPR